MPPRYLLGVLSVLLLCVPAAAGATPRLLFAPVGESDDEKSLEAEVEQELLLALDDVVLESRALAVAGFAQMPVAQQLPLLQPWASEQDVLAVSWLDPLSEDRLRLHLVLAAEGRTVLRVVEAASGPGGAAALALAAREVLSLLLVSRERAERAERESREVEEREPVVVLQESDSSSSRGQAHRWGVHLLPGVGLRPSGAAGPRVLGQLQLGFILGLVGRLSLSLDGVFLLSGGPGAPLSLHSAGGGAQLRWLPGDDKVGAGPLLSVLLMGTRLQLSEDEGLSVEHLDLRLGPGFGLRLNPVPGIGLFLQASLDLLPRPWGARLRSSGALVFASSTVEARLGLGVVVSLPSAGGAGSPAH